MRAPVGLKKSLMTQVWRLQQSQAIISIFFWSLTLAGVFYLAYLHDWFVRWGLVRQNEVFLGTIYLFLIFLLVFLLIGFVYDRVLKLWSEQTVVAYERNPYTRDRMYAKEIVLWRMQVETLREVGKGNPQATERVRAMDAWIEALLRSDPELAKSVRDLESYGKGSAP